ncbi:rhodanese-like domain-containing protein [Flaviaesturariibacter amylovorans]|uniref:Rhodanese-like domain-containing protein n=1 Tax=Flaviaesturariibacter amylovorans TaxID=1084520 RepID=A0ABP8GIG7_9BACT
MKNISVEELKEKMDRGETVHLIDVREPHEYAEAHIAGSRLYPLGKIQTMQVDELEDLKDEPVLLQCRSGHRSMMAAMVLEQLGFKDTSNVVGGILAWQEKGFPVSR